MSNVILADLLYQYNPIEFKEYMATHDLPSDCHRLLIESFCQYMQKELPIISKDADLYEQSINTLLEHVTFSDTDRFYLVFSLLSQKVLVNSLMFDLPRNCQLLPMIHVLDIEKEIGLDGFLVNQFPLVQEKLSTDNLFNVTGDYIRSLEILIQKIKAVSFSFQDNSYTGILKIHNKFLNWKDLQNKVTYIVNDFKSNSSKLSLSVEFKEQSVTRLKEQLTNHYHDFVELVNHPEITLVFSAKDRAGIFLITGEKPLKDLINFLNK